ncbi:MAG: TIGR03862 family flavoprotein [Burkholderiales bacterium]
MATRDTCDDNAPVRSVAVIGGGPAGLMAAEVLARHGVRVDVYDAMRSVGRKFLLAGKGGLNLTHAEPFDDFCSRFGSRRDGLRSALEAFGPDALRAWAGGLGIDTFIGTSNRVFPTDMKAAPLLRVWLHRLRGAGVGFHVRHRWLGWVGNDVRAALWFATPDGERSVNADAVVLALGGGSWPRLGSDAAWVAILAAQGVSVAPLKPANCGFDVGWSEHFRSRYAGHPVKPVAIPLNDSSGNVARRQGEFVLTETGVEGSLIYALSAKLRDAIEVNGSVVIHLDLAPGRSQERLAADLSVQRGARSLANHLRARAGMEGVKAGLLREFSSTQLLADPLAAAAMIKALPVRLMRPRPLDEAISTAGGVPFDALDEHFMLRALPRVFCAGEMLDWEAPTGGYLLTACFATGQAAGEGAAASAKRASHPEAIGRVRT